MILALATALIACENNTKEKEAKKEFTSKTEKVKKELLVKMNFKTNKEDVFKVMINNIVIDEFQNKNILIFETVSPTSNFDQITARFDSNNISNQILINIGNNEVKKLEIKSIMVSYGNKRIDIKTPEDMDKYLTFNKFIDRDSTSTILKTKTVDGRHNPLINLKRNLINALKQN